MNTKKVNNLMKIWETLLIGTAIQITLFKYRLTNQFNKEINRKAIINRSQSRSK